MKASAQRLEAFSDGVMAIIITIMVLNIPLPSTFEFADILTLLSSIFIFFVSFIIVGAQWNKHHILFSHFKEIQHDVVGLNILFLFFLSLIPLFTKWVIQNPTEVIPALCYDIVFLFVNITYQGLFHKLLHTAHDMEYLQQKRAEMQQLRDDEPTWHRLALMIVFIFAIIIISIYLPSVSIFFFIAMPVLFSLWSLLATNIRSNIRTNKIRKRKEKRLNKS